MIVSHILCRFSIPLSGCPIPELLESARILAMSCQSYAGHRRAAKLRPQKRLRINKHSNACGDFLAAQADDTTQQRAARLLRAVCSTRLSRYPRDPVPDVPVIGDGGGIGPRNHLTDHEGSAVSVLGELSGDRCRAAAIVRTGELKCWRAFAAWLSKGSVLQPS